MKRTKLFRWMLAIALSVAVMGNAVCIQATELSEKEAVTENLEEVEPVPEEAEIETEETEVTIDEAEQITEPESIAEPVNELEIPEVISTADNKVPILSYEEFKDAVANGTTVYSDEAASRTGERSDEEMTGNIYSIADFNLDYKLSVDVSSISGERTRPEPNLQIYVNNIDSLKNGNATTQTVLVWLYDDTDADGDTIVARSADGFPKGYKLGELQGDNGEEIGFVTHFFNPGTYTVDYYVMDSSQEINGIRYTLDVMTVGDYDVYSGNLTAADDVHTYNMPIDFSSISTAGIALVQSGKTDVRITVLDENGEKVKSIYTLESLARNWCFIDKPADADGIYNYTVRVEVKDNDYHEGSSGYKVMAGSENDMEEMVSYVDGAVELGKYTAADDTYDFRTWYTPSRFESYYKFTADGASTITAMTKHAETRFKILDASTMEELYNSQEDDKAHRTEYTGSFPYIEKQRLGFTAGVEYYLVLYANNPISSAFVRDNITLTQGMGVLKGGRGVFESKDSITAGTSGYSPSAAILIEDGVPRTAQVVSVEYASANGVMLSDVKSFRVKAQYGLTSWQNSVQYKVKIDYPYTADGNNNTLLMGEWLYSFQAALKTKTMTPRLVINYEYEYGD